ncbi:MAG: hypothetical protein M5R41_17790 [Bacteroidia bacterium]|jgi:hypothetical protein|nr:hypothetical protein [Bacteroidia bacterium]
MAKVQQRKRKAAQRKSVSEAELPQRINYIILIAGIGINILGILIMMSGDALSASAVTVAPVILFIGYCIIIPLGIIYKQKSRPTDETAA